MRVDLVAQRPDLRGLRRRFGIGRPAPGAVHFALRDAGDVKGAPGGEEEEPDHRRVGRVAEPLGGLDLAELGQGQHQRLVGLALDADRPALLDDDRAFLGLVAELLAAFAKPVLEADEHRRHRAGGEEGGDPGDQRPAADAAAEQRHGDVDQPGQDHPGGQGHQLVLEHRARVGAEHRPGDHGQRIDGPEADDRFRRQRPVGEAVGAQRVLERSHVRGLVADWAPSGLPPAPMFAEAAGPPVEIERLRNGGWRLLVACLNP